MKKETGRKKAGRKATHQVTTANTEKGMPIMLQSVELHPAWRGDQRTATAVLFATTFWSFVREFSPFCLATGPYSVHPS